MLQVIVMWNLSRPAQEVADTVQRIELRGYNPSAFLTGEFARKIKLRLELDRERRERRISDREYKSELRNLRAISPLSVGSIADKYCSTRRDLYFTKGINRPDITERSTWGRVAGRVVETYLSKTLGETIESTDYSSLVSRSEGFSKSFIDFHERSIRQLREIEEREEQTKVGDTEWFLKLIDNNSRAEFGLKLLHSVLKEHNSLDVNNIQLSHEIYPNVPQIGINSPAVPDFIIPQFGIAGDIKTGVEFKPHYQLTCAGYAMAYENQLGDGNDVNWGVIYFFPTRNPSAYVRPITFAQVYIFPIDDNLRRWFLYSRDEAYDIISKTKPPSFPDQGRRGHCYSCRFREHCEGEGLELRQYE